MVRFSELMGEEADPEKGQPECEPAEAEMHPDHASDPTRRTSPGLLPPAADTPAPTLPPDSGTPTPANGPAASATAADLTAAPDDPGSPTGSAGPAINDDLLPRRKRHR